MRVSFRLVVLALLTMIVGCVTVAFAQDSTVVQDTTAIVWPATFTLKNFVLGNQMVVTTALTSILLYLASQVPAFAKLGNWITRGIQFLVGSLMSYLIVSWGGTPDPGVAALVTGVVSAVVGGTIFRFGRTQPGNPS